MTTTGRCFSKPPGFIRDRDNGGTNVPGLAPGRASWLALRVAGNREFQAFCELYLVMEATRPRLLELDALRGLAALAVVLFHYTTRSSELFGQSSPLAFSVPWGDHGVDLFFVISGFVILMTLERTKSSLDFVVGRFARLYPAFWVAVGITFAVVTFASLPDWHVSPRDAVLNLTMVPSLLKAELVDGVYWSLQTELFFYAAMLALHKLGCWKRLVPTLAVWLLVATLVQGTLSLGADQSPLGGVLTKLLTLLSLDYIHLFAIGMVLYQMYAARRVNVAGALIILACIAWRGLFDPEWDGAVVVATVTAIMAIALRGHNWLQLKPLVLLGSISYSLYLLHQNIGYVILRELAQRGVEAHLCVLIAIGLSVFLATLLTTFVERPALRAIKQAYEHRKVSRRHENTSPAT